MPGPPVLHEWKRAASVGCKPRLSMLPFVLHQKLWSENNIPKWDSKNFWLAQTRVQKTPAGRSSAWAAGFSLG
jgi:hypothetical protein